LAFNGWRSDPSANHEVNLTPLIDVSLVLVVMLLLATPLAFESNIKVRTTRETAQAAQTEDQDEMIEIRVLQNHRVQVNRETIDREELESILRPMLEASVTRRVSLSCAHGVTHGDFVNAMDTAKFCGATDIAVVERKRR